MPPPQFLRQPAFRRPHKQEHRKINSLWLGHESPVNTHNYIEADLTMKEHALAKLHKPDTRIQRYGAPDSLLADLKML